MAFIILPILSLILYLIGFFSPGLVLYMAVAGLVIAIVSYRMCIYPDVYNPKINFGKYFSLVLVVVGVVFVLVSILSIVALGPVLSSII